MTKNFTLIQLFSIVDGRVFTKMEDMFEIFYHIYNDRFINDSGLLLCNDHLKRTNPEWLQKLTELVAKIKSETKFSDNFEDLVEYLETSGWAATLYKIPQINDSNQKLLRF